MNIVEFVSTTKESVIENLQKIAGGDLSVDRESVPFKMGTADIAVIRGGPLEKASITHLMMQQITPPADTVPQDYMVFQMEIFPANPFCPMGHFNTEWSMKGPGPYHMNLDLFPAANAGNDLDDIRAAMDRVADTYGADKTRMREGLEDHYNMRHWDTPLASKVGCKLLDLHNDSLDLFINAYRSFFNAYCTLIEKNKNLPFTEAETSLKLKRNGKWLEYITLKDVAVKIGLAAGLPPEVLIKLSYPPSAVF